MIQYSIRRFFHILITLFGVSIFIFLSLQLVPGDPAILIAGPEAPQAELQFIRDRYRLDDPLVVQYMSWLTKIVQGDFGHSYRGNRNVWNELSNAYPISLRLAGIAMLLAVIVGIPAGMLAAYHRDGILDLAIMSVAVAGISIPVFWLGLLLILQFSLAFRWLPTSGWGTPEHYIMPVICLSVSTLALLARLTRTTMVEVMLEDYIRTARAKGLAERRIRFGHALQNVLLPIITIVGLRFGVLAGGAVIVETVFAIPGMGTLIVRGVESRDFPIVQGGVLLVAVGVAIANFGADLLYTVFDPRIRYS